MAGCCPELRSVLQSVCVLWAQGEGCCGSQLLSASVASSAGSQQVWGSPGASMVRIFQVS